MFTFEFVVNIGKAFRRLLMYLRVVRCPLGDCIVPYVHDPECACVQN